MDRVCDQNAANFGDWAIEEVAQQRPIFHTLKWTREFCHPTTDFNLDGHESAESVLQYEIDFISRCHREFHGPQLKA